MELRWNADAFRVEFRCSYGGAYLLGWKADAFQLRLSMLLERITMVVVRSYFSGSLCCPMLKGFTVNRSCSTCTERTMELRNTCIEHHTIKVVLYDAIIKCTIIYLHFCSQPCCFESYVYIHAAAMC